MAVNSFREDEKINSTDAKKIISRLFRYLKGYILEIIVILIAMAITVGINLINPLLIEDAIDKYIANSDFSGLVKLVIFAVVINLITAFALCDEKL